MAGVQALWSFVQCPFHALTGLYCPLCGSTRAVVALLHANLPLAARCNLVLVGCVMWTAAVAVKVVGRGFPGLSERKRVEGSPAERQAWRTWAVLAALVVFTVVRNLSGAWWLRP
jgi:hypothetical protein